MDIKKQNLGQFNTKNSVWFRPQIEEFIRNCGCKNIIDPFAGVGDLFFAINHLDFKEFIGFDIDPELDWMINDSLVDIPYYEDTLVLTNPPYLAKNSANRNDYEGYKYFRDNDYTDLYQIAIQRVLEKYTKAVFIIPETYFQTEFFKNYLYNYTIIEDNPFVDTDCPICVACFSVDNDFMRITNNNYSIYKNDTYLFNRFTLENILWCYNSNKEVDIVFNEPSGNLGLRAVDSTDSSIRINFCHPDELNYNLDEVKESSRAITVLNVDRTIDDAFLKNVNFLLEKLREETYDVIFAPFKNNNKLGIRRRRLDFKLARKIIEKCICDLDK